ncbi:hypothetical protein MNB_SUP05-SYMBIONT-7-467 [hydrothermal vent metagenome]|uniref:Uncharacterized protein n=1 Tax=hydrothermal vent metagenome TaxID=652676 RepID=A0A1W1E4A5_9ZZZZ
MVFLSTLKQTRISAFALLFFKNGITIKTPLNPARGGFKKCTN